MQMDANAALADEKGAKFPEKAGALHLFTTYLGIRHAL